MNILSIQIVPFLIFSLIVFAIVPRNLRHLVLVGASYLFYSFFSIPILALIVLTSGIDYILSKIIYGSRSTKLRKALMCVALCSNLSLLAYFKYANCLLDLQHQLLLWLGLHAVETIHLNIILPIGISFYTFEAISYVVDVYRGMVPARSWWHYSLFILWFPHLIAGPIVRYSELRSQFEHGLTFPSSKKLRDGLRLILCGVILKVVLADSVAPIPDQFFMAPQRATTFTALAACLGAGVQLYFDFWGYSQMARGISLLFNIELPINFKHPLNSKNTSEFWQRWQISLSEWLRDYVFYNTGGRSRRFYKIAISLLITMMIAGLWHGAGLGYLVWGLYFGLLQVGYHGYRRLRKSLLRQKERKVSQNLIYSSFALLVTIFCTAFGSALLRARDLPTMGLLTSKLFAPLPSDLNVLHSSIELLITAVCFYSLGMLLEPLLRLWDRYSLFVPGWVKIQAQVYAVGLCFIFTATAPRPFIYFQF